jgi:hypothetical protein
MRRLAWRLDRLATTRPAWSRPAWNHPFDPDRLSSDELDELATLLQSAGRTMELEDLANDQFDRLATLVFLGHGQEWAEI